MVILPNRDYLTEAVMVVRSNYHLGVCIQWTLQG